MPDTVKWLDYEFEIHEHSADWNAVAGLYIFAGPDSTQTFLQAFYIGHTESLVARIPTHPHWQEAVLLGATHVHVRLELQVVTRLAIEQELIRHYQPPLNVQHR